MCGIVGCFGPKQIDLTSAHAAMRHRGPDMQGITRGGDWSIAFNRLSILDLSACGMQPFSFDGVTVVMNGEIYNYRELRSEHATEFVCKSGSDVEILPFLFRKYGLGFLDRLNGMFALIIVDEREDKRYLVRDRYGKKPLFYTQTGDGLFFASELKALKRLTTLVPDRTNIAANLAGWGMIQPLTVYRDVFSVNPGCLVELDRRTITERRWYSPHVVVREQSYEEVRDRFMSLYKSSIDLRFRSDVPVGISLSGGLDSTSMAFLAHDMAEDNFTAFTASITGKEGWEGLTDVTNPRRLCQDLGIRQVGTTVDFDFWNRNLVDIAANYDEVFVNSGTLIFYAISRAARENGVKVLLSGVGGDELFGGYPWQVSMRRLPKRWLRRAMRTPSSGTARTVHRLLARLGRSGTPARLARMEQLAMQFHVWHVQSLSNAFGPYLRDADRAMAERIEPIATDFFRFAMEAVQDDVYNQVHFANMFTVIANQNYQFDMASMRHSVENRSPLLDYKLFEYMMSVPDRMKNQTGPKSLMRGILSEFLPSYITQSGKSGPTMPLDQWFGAAGVRDQARRFVVKHRDLVAAYVSADLAGVLGDDEIYATRVGAMRLFALLSFVVWAKLNIEDSIPDLSVPFTELAAG